MLLVAKHLPGLVLIVVSLLGLARPAFGPTSLYVCPGMIYGAALPPGIDRDSRAWIEGEPFGLSNVPAAETRSIRRPMGIATICPEQPALERVVDILLSKRWQDPSRAIEAEWKVQQPRKAPEMVEDWHEDPAEINLVRVRAAAVGIFAMHYDVQTSTLTSKRIALARRQIDE